MDLDELVSMFWFVWYEGNLRSRDVPQSWFGSSDWGQQ